MDFDISMQRAHYGRMIRKAKIFESWYEVFKELYEKNRPDRVVKSEQLKIPNILHFIWLGSAVPQEYAHYQQSWYELHPTWQIVWWTDHPEQFLCNHVCTRFKEVEQQVRDGKKLIIVDTRKLLFDNRVFFDRSMNYGERSDILKWEAVYRFGGVYIDIDFQALAALDDLHYKYDFYTGMQPLDTDSVQLGAALFAARQGHPIMRACVLGIKNNQKEVQIIVKTGPIHFTRSCVYALEHYPCGVAVALPASYLYPCGYRQRGLNELVWRKPESLAVHQWAGSWLKPEGFVNSKVAA